MSCSRRLLGDAVNGESIGAAGAARCVGGAVARVGVGVVVVDIIGFCGVGVGG